MVVSVAEPLAKTRQTFAVAHQVDDALVFNDWKELHAPSDETVGKHLADAVLVFEVGRNG